LNADLHKN